jgi:hypothetical protein
MYLLAIYHYLLRGKAGIQILTPYGADRTRFTIPVAFESRSSNRQIADFERQAPLAVTTPCLRADGPHTHKLVEVLAARVGRCMPMTQNACKTSVRRYMDVAVRYFSASHFQDIAS